MTSESALVLRDDFVISLGDHVTINPIYTHDARVHVVTRRLTSRIAYTACGLNVLSSTIFDSDVVVSDPVNCLGCLAGAL